MPKFIDNLLAPLRRRSVPVQRTIGSGGATVFGGFLESNEKSADLQGQQRYVTYSNVLSNTSIVAAGTRYFLNLVSKAQWRAEPADDSAQAREIAEMVEDMMNDMTTPWHRVVRRAAMSRFYGFSVQEWTAKRRDDGLLGYLDIEPRPQRTIERWDLDVSGTVHGVVQRIPQTQEEVYIPRGKLVYMVDDTLDDSPEGMGLLRHLVETNKRLQRYMQLEGFGYETDLHGVPIARAPLDDLDKKVDSGELTDTDRTNLLTPLENFIKKHIKDPANGPLGLLLDSATYESRDDAATPSSQRQWDLELLSINGQSSLEAIAAAIERLNRELARILGVEFLLLGGDGKGSLALARDKTQQFGLLVEATLLELRETMDSDFLDPLMRLNGWPEELRPTLKTESIQYRDIEQVTQALVDMAQAGAVLQPDDPAIDEVRDLLGLSRQPEVDLMALAGGAPDDGGNEEEEIEEVEEEEDDA